MITTFDTESIVFNLLSNANLDNSGGIYVGDTRPMDSELEDIVINTIDLTQEFLPQVATSNINIYVKDTTKTINGKKQTTANRARLRKLAGDVLEIVRAANIAGLALVPNAQTVLAEPTISQHFVNIRIDWRIH